MSLCFQLPTLQKKLRGCPTDSLHPHPAPNLMIPEFDIEPQRWMRSLQRS